MAIKIPTYERTISSDLANGARVQGGADANAFGYAEGRALENKANSLSNVANAIDHAGDVISNRALELKVTYDKNRVLEDISKTRIAVNEYMTQLGSQRTGKNAKGFTAQVKEDLIKFKAEAIKGLDSGFQRKLFEENWLNDNENYITKAANHESTEYKKYIEDNTKSTLTNLSNEIASDPYNNERFKYNLEMGFGLIDTNFGPYGEETVLEQKRKWSSASYAGAVGTMVVNDPYKADEFFKANKQFIEPETRNKLDKQIKEEVIKRKSQAIADSIYSKGAGYGDAISKANNIKDVDLRESTVKRLDLLYGQKEKEEKQRDETLIYGVYDDVTRNPDFSLDAIPNNLPPAHKTALQNYIIKKNSGRLNTNWNVYMDLRDRLISGEANLNDIISSMDNLSDIHRRELEEYAKKSEKQREERIAKADPKLASTIKDVWEKHENKTFNSKKEKHNISLKQFEDFVYNNYDYGSKEEPYRNIVKLAEEYYRKGKVPVKKWYGDSTETITYGEALNRGLVDISNKYNKKDSFSMELTKAEEENIYSTDEYQRVSSSFKLENQDDHAVFINTYYIPAIKILQRTGREVNIDNITTLISKKLPKVSDEQ